LRDIIDARFLHQDIVDVAMHAVFFNAEAGRRITLRIAIDNQHTPAFNGERGTKINGRRALADAAFLIHEGDNPTQPMALS
jgi:hypothetical protein